MYRYKSNEYGHSEYRTAVGSTDWNIPMFGYRSAFLIFGTTILVLLLTVLICEGLHLPSGPVLSVTGCLSFGLTIAYSQYFLERKKGMTTGFYVTAVLGCILCGGLLWLFLVQGIQI